MSYKKLEEAIEIAVDMDPNEPPIEQVDTGFLSVLLAIGVWECL